MGMRINFSKYEKRKNDGGTKKRKIEKKISDDNL